MSISNEQTPFSTIFRQRAAYEIIVFSADAKQGLDASIQRLVQLLFGTASDRKILFMDGGYDAWIALVRGRGLPVNLWTEIGVGIGCLRAESIPSPNQALMKGLSVQIPLEVVLFITI